MSFLDSLGKRLSATGQLTAQKTKDIAGSAKTSYTIREEQKKIQNAYREIGRLYYEKHSADPEPELAEQVQIITAANASIKEAEAALAESQKASEERVEEIRSQLEAEVMEAYGVGAKPQDSTRAGSANETVQKGTSPDKTKASGPAVCPSCGAVLVPGARFCKECGASIPAEDPAEADGANTVSSDTESLKKEKGKRVLDL